MTNTKSESIDKIAAVCAMIWFVFIIDACFTWFFPWKLRYIIGIPFIVHATLRLAKDHGLDYSKQRRSLFICFLALAVYMFVVKFDIITTPIKYGPFILILFWRRSALLQFYVYFKKFIVFYCVVSIFVEILVLTDVWRSLPFIVLPFQDVVQENHGIMNYFYGLFVIPTSTGNVLLYRAMGPLREGGHFSIFIGFTYFIEKVVYGKRNVLLVVCGLLTLSPNFLFYMVVTEGYTAFVNRKILKTLFSAIIFVFFVGVSFFVAPPSVKDEIVRIVLERSLEENFDNAQSDEGALAMLDGRTNSSGQHMYERFLKSSFTLKMVGSDEIDEGVVLSDFRILLYKYGYIGFFFIMLCTLKVSYIKRNGFFYGSCVLLMGTYVMLSRAWMFYQMYIWTMMLLAANAKFYDGLNSDNKYICTN